MAVVWLIVACVMALTCATGARRAAAAGWGGIALNLMVMLVAAGACYLIGEAKTGGGFLSGIIGFLLCYLLLFAAAGFALGTAVRWLTDRLNPGAPKAPPAHAWDLWLIGSLSLVAVLASAAE